MYTFEFNEVDIKNIRNSLELEALRLEKENNPKTKEINRLADIFDKALEKYRQERYNGTFDKRTV